MGFKGTSSKAEEAAEGLSTEEAHTEWSLVLDGSSPSYRKGQEEEDAGQVVFQIAIPTRRKMSC